jgi:hypothetical protein
MYQNTFKVIGVVPTVANIGRVRRMFRETNQAAVRDTAYRLMYRSQGMVPYLSGKLYNSAFNLNTTTDPNVPTYSVGYDSNVEYAYAVHEVPGLYHPTTADAPRKEPKSDHFLSIPKQEAEDYFPGLLRSRLEDMLSRMKSITSAQRDEISTGLGWLR